ncbi:MAG: hypothetical protein NXI01_02655 [Gammaproteobacteria bacterium]|nr:hypothetical protein [Gammaproteobacteria bacterium]
MHKLSDFIQAIETGDLDKMQTLLRPRNEHGLPLIDINNLCGFRSALHLICFAAKKTWGPGVGRQRIREMFEYLINLRDRDNNPIANPNIMHRNSGNIITSLIDTGDLYLLQLALDLRNNRGEMVVDIYAGVTPGAFWSPLRRAIYLNNLNMVRALIDARRANGSFWLTRENMLADLRGFLQNHRTNECSNYVNEQLRDRRITIDRNPFDQDLQNTHDPSVTQTVKGSLLALNNSYGCYLVEVESSCIKEIEHIVVNYNFQTILLRLPEIEKRKNALEFWELLKANFNATHSYTGFSMKKLLALVWMGIKDETVKAFPEDIRRTFPLNTHVAPDSIIQIKKASFIEKFIEAAREYKERGHSDLKICIGGAIHKLLEALNRAHVDVVIATGSQSISPAANDMAVAIVGQQLRTRSRSEQDSILSNWDSNISEVVKFKNGIVTYVDNGLKNHFGTLLTEQKRSEIIATLPDMPRPPVPHKDLNATVDIILNTVQKTGDQSRKSCVDSLHQLSKAVYYRDSSDEERYKFIHSEYKAFIDLFHLREQIHTEKNDLQTLPSIIVPHLDVFIASFESILTDQFKSFRERHRIINEAYTAFKHKKIYLLKSNDLLGKLENYLVRLNGLMSQTVYIEHKRAMRTLFKSVKEKTTVFQSSLSDPNTPLPEVIQTLEEPNIKKDITTVQNILENEPGLWRNLHPIIKGILGILAILTIIPAIMVQLFSKDGFVGTFFKTAPSESTKKFESMSLHSLPSMHH